MSEAKTDPRWKEEYKKDVVYLHVIPRQSARAVVNLSPYALKLELWLRINQIPFQTIDCPGFSRKSQSPFVLFNGEEIPDTNFIVEFLSEYFKKDQYPGLNSVERATARAFLKMVEENTSWPIFLYRYVQHTDEYAEYFYTHQPMEVRKQILATLTESVSKRAHGHGIGRHSEEEVQKIGCDDIQAISDFLGDKPYMMGNHPTLVDCSVFGVLSQVIYVPMRYPMGKYIQEKCPNVARLCDRLIQNYWKDWDEQIVNK